MKEDASSCIQPKSDFIASKSLNHIKKKKKYRKSNYSYEGTEVECIFDASKISLNCEAESPDKRIEKVNKEDALNTCKQSELNCKISENLKHKRKKKKHKKINYSFEGTVVDCSPAIENLEECQRKMKKKYNEIEDPEVGIVTSQNDNLNLKAEFSDKQNEKFSNEDVSTCIQPEFDLNGSKNLKHKRRKKKHKKLNYSDVSPEVDCSRAVEKFEEGQEKKKKSKAKSPEICIFDNTLQDQGLNSEIEYSEKQHLNKRKANGECVESCTNSELKCLNKLKPIKTNKRKKKYVELKELCMVPEDECFNTTKNDKNSNKCTEIGNPKNCIDNITSHDSEKEVVEEDARPHMEQDLTLTNYCSEDLSNTEIQKTAGSERCEGIPTSRKVLSMSVMNSDHFTSASSSSEDSDVSFKINEPTAGSERCEGIATSRKVLSMSVMNSDHFTSASSSSSEDSDVSFEINEPSKSELDVWASDIIEEPVNFEVPPLHSKESIFGLTTKEKEKFESEGIVIKLGTWTNSEDNILKRNFKEFCSQYKIYDPRLLLGIGNGIFRPNYLRTFLKAKHFYVRLGKDLNDRSLHHIYRRARIIFNPLRNKRFEKDPTKDILKYQKKLGNKWYRIGNLVNVDGSTARYSYRWHHSAIVKGRWTPEEEEILKKALETVLKIPNVCYKHMKLIRWKEVANLVPNRNESQCRLHWGECMAWEPNAERKAWTKKNDKELIDVLKCRGIFEGKKIDWEGVHKMFKKYAPSYMFLQRKWNYLREKRNLGPFL